MDRRDFFRKSALLAGVTILPLDKIIPESLLQSNNGWKKVINFIGVYTDKGGTIGWYFLKNEGIVVDTQFPDTIANFIKLMRKEYRYKINTVFNTHHHYDHTSGNPIIKDHTLKIVAHENCVAYQKKENKDKLNSIVTADTTFKDVWNEKLKIENVYAYHFGPGHTGGDSVIFLEAANMVHVGDLVFNRAYPYIDLTNGGSIESWIKVLDRTAKEFPKDAIYFFGHANSDNSVVGGRSDLYVMKDYLSALMETVNNNIHKGKTLSDIKKLNTIPKFEYMKENWPGAFKDNLEAAYKELTSKGKKSKKK
jgi:glyoxylase-like metal-dependent hydrolase (beta-lactamase superfamily II)